MKKKRKIRWDRLILVITIFLSIVSLIIFGTVKLLNKLNDKNVEQTAVIIDSDVTDELFNDNVLEFNLEEEIQKTEEKETLISLGEFKLTGYCSCEKCCGQWSGSPCYNGEMPQAEWTIAVDPDIIPINSYVIINGHKYKACDTGSAVNENKIDIYCNTHEECYSEFCNGYAEVYLVQ